MYYLFPVTTWELISQSLRLLCHWRSLAADFVLEAAFLVFFFSYFPHTPFFLCQFFLNWTFCHQTRFITGARVERNSAEIRIRFLLRLGHVRRGFRPCGSFPCRWVRVGGGGSFHPYWERKGVGIQKEIQRGLKGSWDVSPVAWIPSLKLYLLIHVTFKPHKHWRCFLPVHTEPLQSRSCWSGPWAKGVWSEGTVGRVINNCNTFSCLVFLYRICVL